MVFGRASVGGDERGGECTDHLETAAVRIIVLSIWCPAAQ